MNRNFDFADIPITNDQEYQERIGQVIEVFGRKIFVRSPVVTVLVGLLHVVFLKGIGLYGTQVYSAKRAKEL